MSCVYWKERKGRRELEEAWDSLNAQARTALMERFPRLDFKHPDTPSPSRYQKLDNFIKEYAFCDGTKEMAHVYLLASMINHACAGCANAQVWVDPEEPHEISVRLVKPVDKGAEIFIHYNKAGLKLRCGMCDDNKSRRR